MLYKETFIKKPIFVKVLMLKKGEIKKYIYIPNKI